MSRCTASQTRSQYILYSDSVLTRDDPAGTAADLEAYRARFAAWLDEHQGKATRRRVLAPADAETVARWRAWQQALADAGYLGVTWPAEHGGAGGTPAQQVIVEQELERRGLAGAFDFVGVGMIGPTLLAHGSEAQQRRLLRPLLRAQETWCQLLSEPGAGSDLASVSTRARLGEDGNWVIDGQKVWTSFAQHASFGILLARSDPDQPRHRGLTMFAVPMDSPGLTIRPLRQITGEAEFNEVFLDGVRLADEARIAARGEGWRVAVTMLSFERLAVGSGHLAAPLDELVDALAGDPARAEDRHLQVRLGEVAAELLAHRAMTERLVQAILAGEVPGPEAGLAKITSVSASLAACRLAVDALGPEALSGIQWGSQVSMLPGVRSAGGTEEIIRNQIGERVLGLPPEPRGG
jgi:alkylation response protein AidB-like acyl-CoA dehydrogenase